MRLTDIFIIKTHLEEFLSIPYTGKFLPDLDSYEYYKNFIYDKEETTPGANRSFLFYLKHTHPCKITAELLRLKKEHKAILEKVNQFSLDNKSLNKKTYKEIEYISNNFPTNLKIWKDFVEDSVEFSNIVKFYGGFKTLYKEFELLENEFQSINEKISKFYEDVKFYYQDVLKEYEVILNVQKEKFTNLGATENEENDRLYRISVIDPKTKEQVSSKIRTFTDWKYPCLEIGPGEGCWTDNLVGSDPLYLIDIHETYLKKTLSNFNSIYSKRVRTYLVGKENNKNIFDYSMLPNDQIGCIFSWAVFDFYNYKDIDIFLGEAYKILRPGGTLIFSYNDCNYLEGIKFFEKNQKTFLTKEILEKLFKKHNLDVLEFESNETNNLFWVSVRKKGLLQSIKTSQPTVLIQRRKGCERFDNAQPLKYNKQQITRIKQLAIKLGIDTDEKIMSDTYDPHELMELVNIARMNK